MNSSQNGNPLSFIERFILQQFRYGIASLKVRFIAGPVFVVTQIITLALFLTNRTDNSFVVFGLPMVFSIIAALIFLIPRRHNPDYVLYPFFHPSKTFLILVLLVFLIMVCFVSFLVWRGDIDFKTPVLP